MKINSNCIDNVGLIKLLSVLSFLCILILLLTVNQVGASRGYEISLYSVYPLYFWILLEIPFINLFLCIILSKNVKRDHGVYYAIFGAFLSLFILLSLPIFRGYAFYGEGDIYAHLALIKNIALTGHFTTKNNTYPIIHIFLYTVSSFLNYAPEKISLYVPQLFISLYTISMFIFARALKFNRYESFFVVLFSIVPVMGSWMTIDYIMPSTQAFMMIPLFLFLVIKSRASKKSMEFSLLLIPILILFCFFHPESVVFLSAALLALIILFKIETIQLKFKLPGNFKGGSGKYKPRLPGTFRGVPGKYKPKLKISRKFKLENISTKEIMDDFGFHRKEISTLFWILVVGTSAWFISTYAFSSSIKIVYNSFILNLVGGTPPAAKVVSGFTIGTLNAIKIIVRVYGVALIYLAIGGLFSIFTFVSLFMRKRLSFKNLFLATLFLVFAFFNLVFLSKGTSIGFDVIRQLKYSLMVSTLILGIFAYNVFLKPDNLFGKTKLRKFCAVLVMFLLIIATPTLAVFSTFSSPENFGMNYQADSVQIATVGFLIDKKNAEYIPTVEERVWSYRKIFDYLVFNADQIAVPSTAPEKHFGYNQSVNIGTYPRSGYLILYPPINYFSNLYPENKAVWMFNSTDLDRLGNDSTVDLIYTAGPDYRIYYL